MATDPFAPRRRPLPLFLLLLVAFVAGVAADRGGWLGWPSDRRPSGVGHTFDVFWEAWNDVHAHYVDRQAINNKHMTQGAIVGMLASLGDVGHTTYLTKEDVAQLQSGLKGELQGIGARITLRDRRPTIVYTFPGSPAREAGLRPGDVLLQVNGKDVGDLSLQQLVERVRGPAGTAVHLRVQRPGQSKPLDLDIVRAKVNVPEVTWHRLPGAPIAHLALQEFADSADEELRKALSEVRGQGVKGLILDLRGNPGGLEKQAVAVTSEFLPQGDVVYIRRDVQGREQKVLVQADHQAARDMPLVVLIDEGTASSAEILAGALQDYHRGKLVGTHTFGTGTVLKPFALSDGSAVLLAVAEWLTPDGRQIWHHGIKPDLDVPMPADATILLPESENKLTKESFQKINDKQLLKAYELLKEQIK